MSSGKFIMIHAIRKLINLNFHSIVPSRNTFLMFYKDNVFLYLFVDPVLIAQSSIIFLNQYYTSTDFHQTTCNYEEELKAIFAADSIK